MSTDAMSAMGQKATLGLAGEGFKMTPYLLK